LSNKEFLTACGLSEQFGIRYTHPVWGPVDDWYSVGREADCRAALAEDVMDGAVLIHRWVGNTWVFVE
jgi:hypothetical protein